MTTIGVLIANLGTPDHCDRKSVYRYLREFLNDPRVIDLPTISRWPLTNIVIVPWRAGKAAKAYQKIWTDKGSPLLVHGNDLKVELQNVLGAGYQVELGMRYGHPTIASALAKLSHCSKIIFFPLFPQYSSAATGSAVEKFMKSVAFKWNIPECHVVSDFYDDPGFISAYAELVKESLQGQQIDQLILSYHGLPERHIKKSECQAACDMLHACPQPADLNAYCYRAQCYRTSALLAALLGNMPYQVAFQSRLGQTPWIKPYTDHILPELARKGVKSIAVACPSFVADCLETLEEVNMRLREQWSALGGQAFHFIPCLNSRPSWVQAMAAMIRNRMA